MDWAIGNGQNTEPWTEPWTVDRTLNRGPNAKPWTYSRSNLAGCTLYTRLAAM
jgi:hypothetical protein